MTAPDLQNVATCSTKKNAVAFTSFLIHFLLFSSVVMGTDAGKYQRISF